MKNDDYYGSDVRFGKNAFKLEYITIQQLKEALCEQVEDDLADIPHRLLGEIILKNKWMTLEQVENVLVEMSKIRKEKEEKGSSKPN
ncbi:MAG: hypothetical protein AABZ85_08920 [Thermodesulfobacteriota bacterium]